MAQSLYPLRKVQVGLEATAGTAVAATAQLVGDILYTEEIDRVFEEFPRGVRAPVTGGGYDIRGGSMLEYSGNCSYEEIIYPLLTGILNDAAPTGSGPYTWTFDPDLTAGQSVKTATIEFVIDDGSTEHVERESAFMFTTEFEIAIVANGPTTMRFTMAGRRSQTSTLTGSLTPVTGRALIPANLWKVWIDDTWANLGTTAKALLVREATLRVRTGLSSDYTLDGLSDLDMTQINSGTLDATLDLQCEIPAAAATEIGNFRGSGGAGTVRFYRLKADNGAALGANKSVQFDMALKHLSPPSYSQDQGIELVNFNLGLEYDSTGAKAMVATVINGLSAQP
jgi:hypothetical protein